MTTFTVPVPTLKDDEMARPGSIIPGVDPHAAERTLASPVSALAFIRDVALLLKDCAFDARVARRDKWLLVAAAAYLLSPVDLIPDVIPVLGQMDDIGVALWVVRKLLHGAGPAVVADLWRGTDDGLTLVLSAAGMRPGKDKA